MFNRRGLLAAALAGPLLAAGALAQSSKPIVGIGLVTTYSADARIAAVDPNARTVTFTFTNGAVATRKVSPSLANFNASRAGDMVSVSFEDRLTFVVSGPNAKAPRDRDVNVAAAASAGQSAAGVSGDEAIANWWVTASTRPTARCRWSIRPAGRCAPTA